MAIEQTHLERIAVGQRLAELRDGKGYSLRFAAQLAGTDAETLRRFEAGERSPKLEMAIRLAAVYGVTLDELVPPGAIEAHTPPPEVLDFLSRRAGLPASASASLEGEGVAGARRSTGRGSRRSSAASRDAVLDALEGVAASKRAAEQQRRKSVKRGREGGI